jgi:hypothetical protein
MPKAKRLKVNWLKIFKKINSDRKKSESNKKESELKSCPEQYRLEHLEHQPSCSATSSSESNNPDVILVFDSKERKLRNAEQGVVTIDDDENDILVSSMGSSNSVACASAVQHNPGSWYCSAATWASSDVWGSCSSESVAENEILKAVHPGDGASETATASVSDTGMMLSKLVLKPELCVIVFVGLGQEHAG